MVSVIRFDENLAFCYHSLFLLLMQSTSLISYISQSLSLSLSQLCMFVHENI